MSAIKSFFEKTFFLNGTEGIILFTICIAAVVCTVVVIALAITVIVAVRRRKREGVAEVSESVEEIMPAVKAEAAGDKTLGLLAETSDGAHAEVAEQVNEVTSAKKVKIARGAAFVSVRYDKSFTAKLIQSDDGVKGWYSSLKNALLGYKKVNSRISWRADSINRGRIKLAKFAIRGKTLRLYLALNPDDYADTKYKVERAENKRFEDVPCMYRIKNGRRAKYALELIAVLAEKFGLQPIEREQVDYYLPYEENEPLLERGLIKEIVYKPDEPVQVEEDGEVAREVAAAEVSDEEPTEENPVEETAEEEQPVEEETVAEATEELSAEELDDVETYEEKAKDEDGIEVVGVMFRRRGRKVYWFDPDGMTWEKGEIALYKSPDNPPQEVIVVDNAKISPSKLHLPLKPLCKVNRRM